MSKEPLLKCSDLARSYAGVAAVSGVSFEANRGEVLGLLGVNGAGKSTTMGMLCGVLSPSAGSVSICGYDLFRQGAAARRRLGYLPERPPLYPELTVGEYLRFCGRLRGLARDTLRSACHEVAQRCALETVGKRLIGNLSRGYQQRLGLAQALLHDPAVIVLDEPTAGLDPVQSQAVRATIRGLARERAVILSTHILPEVTALCDRVLVLHDGAVVHQSATGALAGEHLLLRCANPPADLHPLSALAGVQSVVRDSEGRLLVQVAHGHSPAPDIARLAVERGWELLELGYAHNALERAFLDLAGATAPGGET